MTTEAEEARSALRNAALFLPPAHVTRDLLAVGVCVRCIFRLFGVHGHVYSCTFLTPSTLLTCLEEPESRDDASLKNMLDSNGSVLRQHASQQSQNEQMYCSICLGILQPDHNHDQEVQTCKGISSVDDFTLAIADFVKSKAYQIDGFMLEISIPPAIIAKERAIWLYLKKKYASEGCLQDKFPVDISVKDALRSSLIGSLESHLGVKSGDNSFRIRLTYDHSEASALLRNSLSKDSFKRRKSEGEEYRDVTTSESDAVISKTLNGLQDHVFCERFVVPPEKVDKPCELTTTCYRMPIYIGGRYLKFSRKVSQSRWIIDDERMGEASVEEIVGSNTLLVCRGDNYKFHAAGREDIDVRMLGSGRPFLVEVSNAHTIPSKVDIQEISDKINRSENKYVMVRNLKVVGSEAWTLMREGESEKQKQYAALVWISRSLTDEDIQNLSSIKDMDILQRTPVRVLHRRSPMERKRVIHWMKVERIVGTCQFFLLHLCTQAGTYIKEFVHGDLGRTNPSIGSILACRAEILQLDVTDVKMDFFD